MVDPAEIEDHGRYYPCAVFTRSTVEDQRVLLGTAEQVEGPSEGRRADVEVPQVAIGEMFVSGVRCGDGLPVTRGAFRDHGEVVEPNRLTLEGPPAGAQQLPLRAQIEHRADAKSAHGLEVVTAQLVEGVAAEEPTPLGLAAVTGGVATEITEVERTFQGDETGRSDHLSIMAELPASATMRRMTGCHPVTLACAAHRRTLPGSLIRRPTSLALDVLGVLAMKALAHWCVRHRIIVIGLWLAALILAEGLASSVGTNYTNSFSVPNTPSVKAMNLLQAADPHLSGDVEQVVFESTSGAPVTDASVRTPIEAMLTKLAALPHVAQIASPYAAGGARQISNDGTIAFARVTFDKQTQDISTSASKTFVATAQSASSPNLTVAVAGQVAEQADRQSFGGTGLGIILAALVLFFVFRSLFAMLMPLASALASLGTGIGVIGLLSNVLKMPVFSIELVALIGLGVGVDYALFIMTRHRQGLMAGMAVEDSIATAVNTSGRAVLFAGIIVCIALLGMFALGVSFLYGLAIAASIGVLFTMIAALTLLPALLSFIGPKILSKAQRRDLAANGPRLSGEGTKGFWPKWADFIRRQPVLPAVAALVIIVLATVPFFSMRLGISDQGNDPAGTTTRVAYDLLAKGFGPGFNGPLELVAVHPGTADASTLLQLKEAISMQPNVASVEPAIPLTPHNGQQAALMIVYPASSPQSSATTDLINHLRNDTIPSVVDGTGTTVYVGGNTAFFVDFANVLSAKLPLFIGLVVVLSFLLLALVFRSLVIPLTAAVMNLLSIGAAFGVLTAVYQWGWLGTIFQVGGPGPVEAFLPVMMFAILFGLSMDYEVFLVTRIHEEWVRTGDNSAAVRNGLAATGKTITAAAIIMILVFGAFILGGIRVIREFGLGLAAGIFMDALIIRMAVVPSLMFLFGKANWWFPSWLDRILPTLHVEDAEAPVSLATAPEDSTPAEPLSV